MEALNKETVALDYLYNILYGMDDKLFVESLKCELEDERIRDVIFSSADALSNLFKEPFDVQKIKEHIKKVHKTYKGIFSKTQTELFRTLENFEKAEFLKEYFSSDDNLCSLNTKNEKVCIEESSDTVLRKITFEKAELFRNGNRLNQGRYEVYYDIIMLTSYEGYYQMEMVDYLNDNCYRIKFSDITVLIQPYNALEDSFRWPSTGLSENPWLHLFSIANNINAHLTYGVANQKEKEISGLIKFLAEVEFEGFDYVPSQLYPLLEKYNLKNKIKAPVDLLKRNLCNKKYEPFWREIFNLLVESQAELPLYFEENISPKNKTEYKQLVNQQMNRNGYEGEYPDYYKKDCVIKPSLIRSYGLSYVVAFEKYVEHHIHCEPVIDNDVVNTAFAVGLSFNKKVEDKTDIYSTMFDCNGKTTFSVISTQFAADMSATNYIDLTTKAVNAAVRKADLKKAEKEDIQFKNWLTRFPKINIKTLLLIFVMFSVGLSLIVPILLMSVDNSTLAETFAFMKSNPFFFLFGIFGGLFATLLIALFEWMSIKR